MVNVSFSGHPTDSDEVLSIPGGGEITDFFRHVDDQAGI